MTPHRLLVGRVMHRRLRPVVHAFSYPVFFIQLSLRDLAAANCAIFSVDRANLLSFRSRDHGARDGSALLPWMQARLRAHGLPDDGEIVLQCFPRVFGFVFNPVSFWFCHDRGGGLIAVLAEVNNTFGGHHQYLLHAHGAVLEDGLSLSAQKAFHVSPFCRVEGSYRFRFRSNATAGQAVIDYDDGAGALLLTSIAGTPRSWSAGALLAAFLRMPLLTAGVVWRIHWQALRLLCKRVPFFGVDPASASPSNTKSRP